MEIQNNKEEVPFSHYLALFEKLDPQEAAAFPLRMAALPCGC